MEKTLDYENQEITFAIDKEKNLMVNATQMAKIFNANVGHFLENDGTKKFIEACLNNRNSDYLNVKTEEDIVIAKQKTGTYMHRILALKFAAWLSPDFEVWVYSTIDEILFGAYKEDEAAEKEIGKIQALMEQKQKQLEQSPIIKEIEELKKKEDRARRLLNIRRKQRTAGYRSMFTEDEMKDMEKM